MDLVAQARMTAALIRGNPKLGEQALFKELTAKGIDDELAWKLAVFVPLAYGRGILGPRSAGGPDLSETYEVINDRGTPEGEAAFDDEPVFRAGLAGFLEDAREGIEGGPLLAVAMWSPELNFVNQALHQGQKLAEVKVGRPSVQVRRPKIH